ncbi:PR domain zinc finger protein 8 [Rhinichthys klamathensis goyatoka]|uniref:PR domain zinc finger protein 8 n=1 Tax=Rhinichthys klamathensis goyatoka TaxID=3034132 RepID=UPI0024B5DCEF|nr:PR domain zinc finger protein 8 [Rhinichthys klamathensis goyatoka]
MGPEQSARSLLDAALRNALSSIVTSRAVPAGAVLGPCAVTHTSLWDSVAFIACKCADRRATACVLQIDPSAASECLQMIQAARSAEEQNLEAFMKNGHLCFRAIKDIPENTELLAWYGRDLAKLLGLSTKKTQGFACSECKQSFLFEFPLLAHQRFFCTEKPTCFPQKLTIPEIHPLSSKPTTDFHNLARELENCKKNRPVDAKSSKRRRSLESDTDESDGEPSSFDSHGDEKVSVKRFCVNGVNRHSWSSASKQSFSKGRNSQCSPSQSHDNSRTDPDRQDLKPITIAAKPAFFTRGTCDVPRDKNRKSAFTQPPRTTPHVPLMPASLPIYTTPNQTAILPRFIPLNLQGSALLYKDLPKLSLPPSANLWPKTSRLQQARATPLQTLLPPSLSSLGLPLQNWCAKCNISFHMTSDLVQHMRSHHKRATTDEKQPRHKDERLKCPICKEAFRERHHLSRHMTSHA